MPPSAETALGVPVDEVRNVVAERTLMPARRLPRSALDAWVRTRRALRRGRCRPTPRGPGSTHALLPERHGHCDAAPWSQPMRELSFSSARVQDRRPRSHFDMICDESGLGHGFKWRALPLGRCCQMGRFVVYFGTSPPRRSEAMAYRRSRDRRGGCQRGRPMEREESLVMLTLKRICPRPPPRRAVRRGLLRVEPRAEPRVELRAEGRTAGRAEGDDQLGKADSSAYGCRSLRGHRRAATDEYREELLEELDS